MQQLCNTYPISCGHDNISSTILKASSNEICDFITLIINQSFSTGTFHENLKLAKVSLIFHLFSVNIPYLEHHFHEPISTMVYNF